MRMIRRTRHFLRFWTLTALLYVLIKLRDASRWLGSWTKYETLGAVWLLVAFRNYMTGAATSVPTVCAIVVLTAGMVVKDLKGR